MTRPLPPWLRGCSPVAAAIFVVRRSSDISARRPTVVLQAVSSGTNTHVGFTVISARNVGANFLQHVLCALLVDVLLYSVKSVRCPAHRPACRPILPDIDSLLSRARSPRVIWPLITGPPANPRVLLRAAPTRRRTIAGRRRSPVRIHHGRPRRLCVAAWTPSCRRHVGDVQNLVYMASHVQEPPDFGTHFGHFSEVDVVAES